MLDIAAVFIDGRPKDEIEKHWVRRMVNMPLQQVAYAI